MNILIYMGHPAQYYFFKNIIKELEKAHSITVLIKTKDVLEQLLQNDKLNYINIQTKSRKNNFLSILIASFLRTIEVYKITKSKNIEILLGTDSSIAQAAFLAGKKAITTLEDDYEVIRKLAKLTYPFTDTILVPDICNVGKWEKKKVPYSGYMKLSYLHPNRFVPDIAIKNKYIQSDNYCLLRLAGLTAHHDKGINGLNTHLVEKLIEIIKSKGYDVFLSSEYLPEKKFEKYLLNINQSHIHHVLAYSSLLISDSQSMSVEAAVLGVPSLRFSDFSGRISVLEELEHKYRLTFGIKTDNPARLLELTTELLSNDEIKSDFQNRREIMLYDKIDVSAFIIWFIENYPESKLIAKKDIAYQFRFR